ncbi:MAG: Branched-chain-amino-acid aminotransferase [Phycisphaerae bacterium]|nr:Branched-chain-amino-acid aminotransferase [Phycisphaerae bacterium]
MIHPHPNPYSPDPKIKVWIDGTLYPADQAKISVWDHGLLYGDGVFEGIRIYNKKIFAVDEHLARLFESAKALKLTLPMSAEELNAAMRETMAANNIIDGYIRLVATRGVGTLGLSTKYTANPSIIIIAASIALYPPELYESGLSLIVSSYVRNHPNAVSPRVKSLNYLNSILAKIEAHMIGAQEAVLLNHMGLISECCGDNIFLVKNRQLYTPDTSAGILAGITRDIVIQLARKRGLTVHEARLVRHDLYAADEIFLTGTAAEIIGATNIDGRQVGNGRPGEITRLLQDDYKKYRTGT